MSALLIAAAVAGPAVGADIFYSSDADRTEVLKAGVDFDLAYAGPEKRIGIRVEKARFTPLGGRSRTDERAYLRVADSVANWKWSVALGTDGRTLLGSVGLHDESRFRKEFFVEREIVETREGVDRGLYYTFAGTALDLPADDRNIATIVAGLQKFSGDNLRVHARATLVHVIKPQWGLSAQLRTRYFHSSDPHEFDYYSPRWYAEVLPVVQVRRFVGGWQLLGAAGYGAQRDSDSGWRSSRYLNARVTSPAFSRDWALNASLLYTNTPVSSGSTYRYTQFSLGLSKAL